jgi:DNA-binding CsgD family transcriptional regulator
VRPTTTVVLHRDRLVAEALAAALERAPGIAVVATTDRLPTGRLASGRLGSGRPDMGRLAIDRLDGVDAAVVDAGLPDAAATATRLRGRGLRVVALGEPLAAAHAHVGADRPIADLVRAIAPAVARGIERLSAREHEVVSLAGQGLAGKQIARLLGISHKTVEHHKTRAFAKLGVPNQAAAVAALLEEEGRWIRSAI